MDLIRSSLNIVVGRWKALLIAFVLFSVTGMGIEGTAPVATFARGTEGLLGVQGDTVLRVGNSNAPGKARSGLGTDLRRPEVLGFGNRAIGLC